MKHGVLGLAYTWLRPNTRFASLRGTKQSRQFWWRRIKTESPTPFQVRGFRCGWAATYFPTLSRSIIGAAGLNFSVRDGKRCAPALLPPLVSLVAIGLQSAVRLFLGALPGCGKGEGRRRVSPLSVVLSRLSLDLSRKAALPARPRAFGPLVPLGSTSRNAHTCGLSTWSSATALKGGLISGPASRLDAFSAYPIRTRLPGCAPGGTTGTP